MGQDKQLMATIMLMKKCPHTYMILDKCMELLNHDPKLITDHYNKENQHPNFKDNRHDQSILSVVRNKYGSCIIPDETFTSKNWSELHHIPFLSRRRLVRDIYNKPIDQETKQLHSRIEELEDSIEHRRTTTRESLLMFGPHEDIEVVTKRIHEELEALDKVAATAGEPMIDAELVALVMAMDLEQIEED